jgi:hypothetical protein
MYQILIKQTVLRCFLGINRINFATRFILSGVDLVTVSKLPRALYYPNDNEIYAHPTPEALKTAVSKLSE